MSKNTVQLVLADGKTIELPILKASEGIDTLDIRSIYSEAGYFTFDPGFVSTASCESKITYINGNKGELKYRDIQLSNLLKKVILRKSATSCFTESYPHKANSQSSKQI